MAINISIQNLINSNRKLSDTDVNNLFYYFYGRQANADEKKYWGTAGNKTSSQLSNALTPNAKQFTNAGYYKDVLATPNKPLTPATPKTETKQATLYNPKTGKPTVVTVGSSQASQLQSQGYTLNKPVIKAEPKTEPKQENLNTSKLGNSGVNALFKQYYGRDATQDELNYWSNKSDAELRPKLIPNSATELEKRRQEQIQQEQPDITPEATDEATGASDNALYQPFIDNDPFLAEQLSDPDIKAKFDSLPDELKYAYIQSIMALGKSIEAGKVINPNIEITPEQAKEFSDQAFTELDPYYQEKIKNYKQDLETSTKRLQEDFEKGIRRAEEPFKQNLQAQAEVEAQAGLTYGSERIRREGQAITKQQQGIDDYTTEATRKLEDARKTGERYLGSDILGGMETPSLGQYNVSRKGFEQTGTRKLPALTGGLMGELPKQQTVDLSTRASDLEEAYRKQRILDLTNL